MRRHVLALLFLAATAGPVRADAATACQKAYEAKNLPVAALECRKAAEQGVAEAQFNLGVMYEYQAGVPRSDREAAKWYRKAAEQGLAKAQIRLGFMYWFGQGVPKNIVEALTWYRKAAEQGNAVAQFHLGTTYEVGRGVPRNNVLAHMWLSLAAAWWGALHKGLPKNLKIIEKQMTPAAVAKAKELATKKRREVAAREKKPR